MIEQKPSETMVTKAKGKQWYKILAPAMFGSIELGKTSADEPEKLIGRKVSVSLMTLLNDFRKYYVKFKFSVNSVDGDKAVTVFSGSECMRDHISRLVRRRSKRVDTVQDLITKDGVNIRVKGLAIVPKQIKTSVKDIVRSSIRDIIKTEVEKNTLEGLIKRIISDDIKHRILRESGKIYPIRNFEVRRTDILNKNPLKT